MTGKRFFAHYGLTIDKARTFDAEAYDNGIVGFTLTEEPEAEAETLAPAKKAPAKKAGGPFLLTSCLPTRPRCRRA